MSNHPSLVQKARDFLQSGQFPSRPPDRIWGGASSGAVRCPVCEEMIANEQIVWEAEFVSASGSTSQSFHVFCYRLIESLRRGT